MAGLETDPPKHDQLIIFNRITESDITHFQSLASQAENTIILSAAPVAVTEMREVLGTIQHAKTFSSGAGWRISKEQRQRWIAAKYEIERRLQEIKTECEKTLANR
jgi:hypothetical protein